MARKSSQTIVTIAKGEDPSEVTKRTLSLIQPLFNVTTCESVLIKPNCVKPSKPSTGITTDARVVEPIIEYLKDRGIHNITIAEGGNPGTDRAFKLTGFSDLSKRQDVKLVNLNKDEWRVVQIPNGVALREVRIAKTVLDCDCVINVPKLKIHSMAQVTLSMKNLMGVIVGDRGEVMHSRLNDKIVDLASLFKPRLNVIDGIVGAEVNEVVGQPVVMNTVVSGVDMVATDAVGSAIMGVDPLMVQHIQKAANLGLGIGDLKNIVIRGDSIESVQKSFRH